MSEAKEGQVQEVVSEDKEELVVDVGVGDETLMEDTVLIPHKEDEEKRKKTIMIM